MFIYNFVLLLTHLASATPFYTLTGGSKSIIRFDENEFSFNSMSTSMMLLTKYIIFIKKKGLMTWFLRRRFVVSNISNKTIIDELFTFQLSK
jgi:hypothetical protein